MTPLTRDDFKVWSLADASHSVSKYMCIAKQNPEQVVDQIIVNQEDAIGFQELIKILVQHCGETGENEGAVETLNRIIEGAEKYKKLYESVQRDRDSLIPDIEIVERLDKRIEELEEIAQHNFANGKHDAVLEWDINELQKIRGEKNE